MSWFDTSGIANIAKTALKEAQRTIDKALDIKEDDGLSVPVNTPIDTNSDDFFGTWGLTHSDNGKGEPDDVVTRSPTKPNKQSTSIWGSFTGSFFETQIKDNFRKQPRDSVDSLDDSVDLGVEHFSGSKLVVHDDSDLSRLSVDLFEGITSEKIEEIRNIDSNIIDMKWVDNTSVKIHDKSSSSYNNRLSVISTESDRKSSESVEVLSGGTGCTTTPDSEAISLSSSALDSKPASESVEVLPYSNSLTSPSSVEVINSDVSSRRQSQFTDEFVSPLQSPEENFSAEEKITPDSVEVIPEDLDENSIAEDTMSYNSLSESTATTVFDNYNLHLKQKPLPQVIAENTAESAYLEIPLSPDKTDKAINLTEIPITRAPSRGGMHLPIQPNLIDTQPQSYKQDLSSLIKTSNIIDIPHDTETSKSQISEDGSQSDKTLIASDSIMESSSDTSTTTDSNTNSLYLKNLLADAMTEKRETESSHFMDLTQSMIDSSQKPGNVEMLQNISITQLDMVPRDSSPISSESRSDLVKIGSDHTSAHTSGDELETTTSSDIEIISSPNCDSSSTHSRHSPAKLVNIKCKGEPNIDALLGKMTIKKIKGHNRELSEASSVSDDTEIERLVKRLSEMTEILESRETKLIEITRKNSELQDVNNDLRKQLDIIVNKQVESMDVNQVTEEYTQRLSALERKFQQAIREKDTLRKQLEQCKLDNSTRMSKGELDTVMEEKEQIIKELREEGEKLSKQQLQHSNIIKKLRTKEKENETTIKHLKETVEDLSSETDRLKRSLTAKEDVERSQIEAVHQLTTKNKKLENEINQVQGNFDDLTQKHETVKKSLDAAKKELIDKNKTSTELVHREHMLQTLENEKRMTESQNEEIINQLEDLRSKLREANQDYLGKEQSLRMENIELMRRLEDAESRNEELAQSVLEVSKPLVRQLDSLQATHNMKLTTFEKTEQELLMKISEIQNKLIVASESEKYAKDECALIKNQIATLEHQLSLFEQNNEKLSDELAVQKTENMRQDQQMRKEIDNLLHKLENEKENELIISKLQTEIESLQELLFDANSSEALKKNNVIIPQEHIVEKIENTTNFGQTSPNVSGNISPAVSLGRVSLGSLKSIAWPFDETGEGSAGKCTNMLEMQLLQSNLKQRDGEVQQLQWELTRREHERTLLNTEISNLLSRVEELEAKCANLETTQKELSELQQKYETLCQLYGEKVEETEELKLDLQEVKEMYKMQIDELLKNSTAYNVS